MPSVVVVAGATVVDIGAVVVVATVTVVVDASEVVGAAVVADDESPAGVDEHAAATRTIATKRVECLDIGASHV